MMDTIINELLAIDAFDELDYFSYERNPGEVVDCLRNIMSTGETDSSVIYAMLKEADGMCIDHTMDDESRTIDLIEDYDYTLSGDVDEEDYAFDSA